MPFHILKACLYNFGVKSGHVFTHFWVGLFGFSLLSECFVFSCQYQEILYISYFSVTVTKHHNQGDSKNGVYCGPWLQAIKSLGWQGNMAASSRPDDISRDLTVHVFNHKQDAKCMNLSGARRSNPKACPSVYSFSRAAPPSPNLSKQHHQMQTIQTNASSLQKVVLERASAIRENILSKIFCWRGGCWRLNSRPCTC